MNTKNLVVEFVGTFALIFIGAGAHWQSVKRMAY